MMFGALPPSSSETFLRLPAAAATMRFPVAVDPVNAILSTSRCSTRAAPASPKPVTMLSAPGGKPASSSSSPSRSAVSGVCSAGLRTTVLPAVSAGITLKQAIVSGKFQGTMPPTTPIGSRTVYARYARSSFDIGIEVPSIFVAQPAK